MFDDTPPVPPVDDAKRRLAFLVDTFGPLRPILLADIGANPTEAPPYAEILAASLCHVWGFEPDPRAYQALLDMPRKYVTVLATAVGNGTQQDFHSCARPVFSSLYPASQSEIAYLGRFHEGVKVLSKSPVKTEKLDDLTAVPALDFLKIDAQGAELQVLQNGREKLRNAVGVIVELRFLRLYENEPVMGDVDLELRAQGFFLHKFIAPKSVPLSNSQSARLLDAPARNQLVDGDAVYLRGLTNPDTLSDMQLMFLALLSDSVFFSHDLTLRCLDLLVARGAVPANSPEQYVDLLPKTLVRAVPE